MSAPVREGEILAGKYRVDKVLGTGGMGVVVAAHHVELDEKVAIKFLLPEALSNQEAVARFSREARAAVKIKSEHVARVTDVGRLENGAPYMVMEYLEGGDLSRWLSQRGALPIEQAVEFVLQACEAIAEAHVLRMVHRDLKPANLFVIRLPDGHFSVKVLDFGISKVTSLTGSGNDAAMTKTSALMGSPLYMSPEQMQSAKNVDARGDIWALGVILYELVTGAAPFNGETMPELILQIMSASPTALRDKRPDAPSALEGVISKCLEKDRGRRFQTVGELASALLPFAPRRSRVSVERISGVLMAAGLGGSSSALPDSSDSREPAITAGTSWGRTTLPRGSGKMALAVGTVVAVLAVAGLAVFARRSHVAAEPLAASSTSALTSDAAAPVAFASPSVVIEPAGVPAAASASARLEVTSPSAAHPPSARPLVPRGAKVTATVAVASPAPKPAPPAATPPPSPAPTPVRVAPPPPTSAHGGSIFDDRK